MPNTIKKDTVLAVSLVSILYKETFSRRKYFVELYFSMRFSSRATSLRFTPKTTLDSNHFKLSKSIMY